MKIHSIKFSRISVENDDWRENAEDGAVQKFSIGASIDSFDTLGSSDEDLQPMTSRHNLSKFGVNPVTQQNNGATQIQQDSIPPPPPLFPLPPPPM